MLHRKKSSYLEKNLVQNSKNPNQLCKNLKCLGLYAKEGNKAKFYLTKDGKIRFEPRENANIFKKFYPELATNLVKKIPIAPNIFNSSTTKDYYTDNLKITETSFSYSRYLKMQKNCLV